MLTRLRIRNFKQFDDVDIELGSPVVFIGPNNSGKTTALQALALWELGVRRWMEKRAGSDATKRTGVAINRQDLFAIPVPRANFLWRDLHTRSAIRDNGNSKTQNIRIEIDVSGCNGMEDWNWGLEFDYANEESFYCRPMSGAFGTSAPVLPPSGATGVRVAYLPPMSGLADREFIKQEGEMNFLIGQGRTAEVLRNLCRIAYESNAGLWEEITKQMEGLFGIQLESPQLIPERSEVRVQYRQRDVTLDLSASGRGVQQTLLLLTYLASNPGRVLLLDEPDAHLEILRQRQIYSLLQKFAADRDSQIIAASHSEIVLNEAAKKDVVIAFLGTPKRIDDRGSQVLKALRDIPFADYYAAETAGSVLYLEGSTDLAVLAEFARTLRHRAEAVLAKPFVQYVGNVPPRARDHFQGLKAAVPRLRGLLLVDRIDRQTTSGTDWVEIMWRRREIENYLCQVETLLAWARAFARQQNAGPLWDAVPSQAEEVMREVVRDLVPPVAFQDAEDPFWHNVKASDDFLDRVFEAFFGRLRLSNEMPKNSYYVLARHVPATLIDAEVVAVLDQIAWLGESGD
jgi:predicted ATPase